MGRAVLDHFRNRVQDPRDRAERGIGLLESSNAIEVTKQFVGAVDEVNDHKSGGQKSEVRDQMGWLFCSALSQNGKMKNDK